MNIWIDAFPNGCDRWNVVVYLPSPQRRSDAARRGGRKRRGRPTLAADGRDPRTGNEFIRSSHTEAALDRVHCGAIAR
jgi:hypothetical protein